MAKKASKNKSTTKSVRTKPGAQPTRKNENTTAKSIAKIVGCLCLAVFIFFDELWVGTLSCALAFGAYFVLQVFIEKSREWYTSGYLYGTVGCLILAYLEYSNHFISNLMGL